MAETLPLAVVQDPEAPLDAAVIQSRFEQLLALLEGDEEEPVDAVAEEDAVLGLLSECEADMQAVDAWDSSAAALGSDGLAAYIEWLRKEVSLAEEENRKLSVGIGDIGDTVFKDTILLDADIESLESSLDKIDSEGLKHLEASPDSGLNQTNFEKDYIYEALELDYEIEKSEMDLELLQIQSTSMQRLKNKIHVVENIMLPGQTADETSAQVNLETKTVDELLALNIYNNECTFSMF
ncbi:hypothetical protein ACQ4PT_047211 [Festuca glaucescens]